jgi:hypothetical protein
MMLRLAMLIAWTLATPAQAASLTLGCFGHREVQGNSDGSPLKEMKEDVFDMSIVVDFDQRVVSGFWVELNGRHNPIPLTGFDANSVQFEGTKEDFGAKSSIQGTVDRITGKVDALEFYDRKRDYMRIIWDLRCKPMRRLF